MGCQFFFSAGAFLSFFFRVGFSRIFLWTCVKPNEVPVDLGRQETHKRKQSARIQNVTQKKLHAVCGVSSSPRIFCVTDAIVEKNICNIEIVGTPGGQHISGATSQPCKDNALARYSTRESRGA